MQRKYMQSGGLRTKGITKQPQPDMPLITVVTVVRNGERTLEQTMLSVINQTYSNVEYIVVDGASADGTLDIIKKYEDWIDYWLSEPDEGIYYAMNKGIDLATGEWINFMNSGDSFYSENTLAEVLYYITPNIDIIYGDAYYSNGKIQKSPHNLNIFILFIEHMICHQAIFVRLKYLKNHFDVQYKIVADREWLMKIMNTGVISKHISVIICIYDDSGVSSNSIDFLKDSMLLVRNQYGIIGVICIIIKRFIGRVFKFRKLFQKRIRK